MKRRQDLKRKLDEGFRAAFGGAPERYFSAPGRTELGGNHTDHQRGRVLAGAVNRDIMAAVRKNGTDEIRVLSEGYPPVKVSLQSLSPIAEEKYTTAALIRGVAAQFVRRGIALTGFDAYCCTEVLPGSGLSSSAAFEVLTGTILNHLFCAGKLSPLEIAQMGQCAENRYFGKPCGLMDQVASAVGGLVTIDFADAAHPAVKSVDFDFDKCGYGLCILDSGADHAGLTKEYAAVTEDFKALCSCFEAEVLTQVPEEKFYAKIPQLRKACGDRAVLRGIHEYAENLRVQQQVQALEQGQFDRFLSLTRESGRSSFMYLQNVIPLGAVQHQELALALGLCEHFLQGQGAFRVHGGGFAGTVQAFVPIPMLEDFRCNMEKALGTGCCQLLSIRMQGGCELAL